LLKIGVLQFCFRLEGIMSRFHCAALAAVAVIGFASVASAADTPTKAPVIQAAPAAIYNWTGWYVGGNAGGAWGHSNVNTTVDCPANGYFCQTAAFQNNGPQVAGLGSGSLTSSGFTGGVQGGYNWQTGALVVGFESDFDAFRLSASRSAGAIYSTGAGTNTFLVGSSIDTDWLFTARGRLGWSVSNILIYATGGLALTDLKVSNSYSDSIVTAGAAGATENASQSQVKAGWALGVGVEWALSRNWSIKGDYSAVFLDAGVFNFYEAEHRHDLLRVKRVLRHDPSSLPSYFLA
jgi:outer membrane immunogenic protein